MRGNRNDTQFRQRNNRGTVDPRPVTTFFISNLPTGVTDTLLWKAFQPHGIVRDVYVARKTDAKGKWFGFVRYLDVKNLNEVLRSMNTVKIDGVSLGVSVAKYGKEDSRPTHYGGNFREERRVPTQPPPRQYPVSNGLGNKPAWGSFKAATGGGSHMPSASSKVLVINERGALYPEHCIMRTVIGEVIDMDAFKEVKNMLKLGGYVESPVSLIGGTKILVGLVNIFVGRP